MINLKDYPIFEQNLSNLKETSLDEHDSNQMYMTQSTRKAINFDGVKTDYVKSLGLSDIPKSNDALFDEGNGELVFVEFKNGFMNNTKQFAVRKKIYDSVIIFTDITSKSISYMRKHMKYILVYNENINQSNDTDEELQKKQRSVVQSSTSFDDIAKAFGSFANEEYICFGIKIFQNYCFKEVHTYTEKEFDSYLSTLEDEL